MTVPSVACIVGSSSWQEHVKGKIGSHIKKYGGGSVEVGQESGKEEREGEGDQGVKTIKM